MLTKICVCFLLLECLLAGWASHKVSRDSTRPYTAKWNRRLDSHYIMSPHRQQFSLMIDRLFLFLFLQLSFFVYVSSRFVLLKPTQNTTNLFGSTLQGVRKRSLMKFMLALSCFFKTISTLRLNNYYIEF